MSGWPATQHGRVPGPASTQCGRSRTNLTRCRMEGAGTVYRSHVVPSRNTGVRSPARSRPMMSPTSCGRYDAWWDLMRDTVRSNFVRPRNGPSMTRRSSSRRRAAPTFAATMTSGSASPPAPARGFGLAACRAPRLSARGSSSRVGNIEVLGLHCGREKSSPHFQVRDVGAFLAAADHSRGVRAAHSHARVSAGLIADPEAGVDATHSVDEQDRRRGRYIVGSTGRQLAAACSTSSDTRALEASSVSAVSWKLVP